MRRVSNSKTSSETLLTPCETYIVKEPKTFKIDFEDGHTLKSQANITRPTQVGSNFKILNI